MQTNRDKKKFSNVQLEKINTKLQTSTNIDYKKEMYRYYKEHYKPKPSRGNLFIINGNSLSLPAQNKKKFNNKNILYYGNNVPAFERKWRAKIPKYMPKDKIKLIRS